MHARSHNRGSWFTRFAKSTARASGHPAIFCGAVAVIVLWAASGPLFGFSDTWQVVIDTGTTIITFLMVFLIQNTQNRDSEAIQVKLDDKDLDRICAGYRELARQARKDLREGKSYTDVRESRCFASQAAERQATPRQILNRAR